jgi:hypothetical protein
MLLPGRLAVLLLLLVLLLAAAASVDTTAFDLIAPGMTEHDVRQRLGEPDQVDETAALPGGRQAKDRRLQGVPVIQRSTWVYAGITRPCR